MSILAGSLRGESAVTRKLKATEANSMRHDFTGQERLESQSSRGSDYGFYDTKLDDGYTQYESEFVEETRPPLITVPAAKPTAIEIVEDVMERVMIEAAKSYGAAQTARETYLLDRLRTELIDSEMRAIFYRNSLREPAKGNA